MSTKTIDTDYYRVVVNADGSLTFTDKNTGAIILDNSPHVYLNSNLLSNGNNAAQQITTSGDTTTVTITDNDNPYAALTQCYRFNTHSPYIEYAVTWRYKKAGLISEERFDFIVPGQDARVLTRDLQLVPFNPTNTYRSDLYTPRVVKFVNGLYFLGSDTMESMKIQAADGKTQVSFYSDYSENHPHFHYIKNGGGANVFTNETQRDANDTASASLQFAVDPGETRRCLIKTRQPYGYDAVLLLTSHPDSWTIETANAVAYGSANENAPGFGSKGIVGRGLGWTHGTFKNGQWYSLEYSGTAVKKFIDRMYADGVEIVPHSITPSTDSRTVVEHGLETFAQYKTRNWIDHGAGAGSDNFEDLASQGAIKGDEYYILDILAKYNYRYAWSYIDLTTDNYAINLLKPGETAAIRPLLFYNNRLDDNIHDNNRIYLWSTMNTQKKVDLFYTAAHVDALIAERGVHIGHEYFGYPTCENHVFYKNNGVTEIYPAFDAQLEYIAKKRADGLVWSPIMAELGDYWVTLKDVTLLYNNDGTITVTNNSPADVAGLTMLAEEDIRSVIFANNDLVSFGEPHGKRELVLPAIPAGNSAALRVNYGTKDSRFPTIVSNDAGKNKVNEITGYWSNAKKTLTMTAAARGGRHSFTVKVPVFADKTVTVTDITAGAAVGNYMASNAGKITFETGLKNLHTFEIKTSAPVSSTLTVASPNGGENWAAGSMQMIKWASAGIMGEVKIEYSTDKGVGWNTITPAAPNNGGYCWTVAQAASAQCLVRISGAADGTPADTSNNTFSILHIAPQISLNHTRLNFGVKQAGPQTTAQSLLIANSGGSNLDWSIAGNVPWLKWTPSAGKNKGEVTVTVDPGGVSPGTYTGVLSVAAPNAANSPQVVDVTLNVYDSQITGSPFGCFDTPAQDAAVCGCVAFTGWALDNIGVDSVKLYRETEQSPVYIGDAVFIEGARPDVEKKYPGSPFCYRAGWGYMMLTNFLPNTGNGTFKIHAAATNKEGKPVTLGIKTINVNNAGAVKPFGAIDMPGQGGTASGSNYRIAGWVLTPAPNSIPTDGSTIAVYIDGVYVGRPTYNIYRADVAGLFPGYANSNGAHAYLDIDTTAYQNGMHQVYWIVADSAGNAEGIGSRFFTIRNNENKEMKDGK
ncbi:MAG: hypothetical protein NT166_21545 [Candidatus Aminicenantes bacterium]|nr:hypothetical protein [Candidatus Aminicenantes bacterium]